MYSAEDIVNLEKKWFKYQLRKKIKVYFSLLIFIGISIVSILIYINNPNIINDLLTSKKIDIEKNISTIINKNIVKEINTSNIVLNIGKKKVVIEDNNSNNIISLPNLPKENSTTIVLNKAIDNNKNIIKKEEQKIPPFTFKIEPSIQGNELFSSSGYVKFNPPFEDIKTQEPLIRLKELNAKVSIKKPVITKKKISIKMDEVDTISYLKEKFYSTSNMVFALMLSEEYYKKKEYKNASTWALTANDINSQNDKSWFWFAKSQAKLGNKDNAVRALKAYLNTNESKILKTLLNKIEYGDIK